MSINMDIGVICNKNPATLFQWRDRTGAFYFAKDMKTRHLFYVLRMIWNHTMPDDAKLKPYQKYKFSKFYTEEYLLTAIQALYKELKTRPDLTHQWKSELVRMSNYVNLKRASVDRLGVERGLNGY